MAGVHYIVARYIRSIESRMIDAMLQDLRFAWQMLRSRVDK
jgi:hypothetical protein